MTDVSKWNPKLQRLHRYWVSIHPDTQRLPGRQNFDPVEIRDLLPNVWLLDVQRKPFRLKYRLMGTRVVEWIGKDYTGRWLDEVHPHIPDLADDQGAVGKALPRFKTVVEQGVVDWRRGKPSLFLAHKDFVEIERALLPLASDGHDVDVLLAGTVFYGQNGESE